METQNQLLLPDLQELVAVLKKIHLLPADIIYAEASINYTTFYLQNGKKVIVAKPLKTIEALLNQPFFFRTHKSFLVNLNFIKSYVCTEDEKFISLTNNRSVSLSRRRQWAFKRVFNSL